MAPIYSDGHDKSLGLEKPVRVQERVFRFATVLREEKTGVRFVCLKVEMSTLSV